MEKQKLLENAYGEYSDIALELCDENGWIKNFEYYSYFPQNRETKRIGSYLHSRPKSLSGIENNNGWTRIKSIEDLPKEKVNCYFSGYNTNTKEFYISQLQERDNTRLQNLFESKYLTHIYIVNPTPKPKPPLYL